MLWIWSGYGLLWVIEVCKVYLCIEAMSSDDDDNDNGNYDDDYDKTFFKIVDW